MLDTEHPRSAAMGVARRRSGEGNTTGDDTTMSQQSGGLLCPACRVDLAMSERNGVEIDYCPKCRGAVAGA